MTWMTVFNEAAQQDGPLMRDPQSGTLMPAQDSLLQGAKLRVLCSSGSGERLVGCKGLLQLRFGRCHAHRGNLTAEILLAGQ